MARKKLKKAGDTERKVRWNKKKTRKYAIENKLIEVREKPKRKPKAESTKAVIKKFKTAARKEGSKDPTKAAGSRSVKARKR